MNQEQGSNNNEENQVKPLDQPETYIVKISQDDIKVEPPINSIQATYSEKTERFKTWVQLLKSIGPYIWMTVILIVIIPLIGQIFIANAFSPNNTPQKTAKDDHAIVVKQPDWRKVNESMKATLDQARNTSEEYANQKLDLWIDELMKRVDDSFLDWYFGYFNQKKLEYQSFFVQLSSSAERLINSNKPTPEEKVAEVITQEFQTEFANRVLRPEISQLRLERLTQETVEHYLRDLRYHLNDVPIKYQIPQADWDRYLNEIAITINDSEGKTSTLSLKVLAGGGAYLALKPLVAPLVLKVGSKVVAKMASKVGVKIATKTGVVFTGKVASALLDATVGVGIIIWDLWDTNHTATIEKPILRENIAAYLQEVKVSLLNNSEKGIMTAIKQIESQIVTNLDKYAPLSH
jgi:hypothetical protein